MPSRARREPVELRIPRVELVAIALRLLEVVADDLVAFEEVLGRKPVGEALVQLGAGRLRERLVRGVTDQQVAEAEAFVAGERRRRRANELLANERLQMRLDGWAHWVRREHRDRPAVEHLAFD